MNSTVVKTHPSFRIILLLLAAGSILSVVSGCSGRRYPAPFSFTIDGTGEQTVLAIGKESDSRLFDLSQEGEAYRTPLFLLEDRYTAAGTGTALTLNYRVYTPEASLSLLLYSDKKTLQRTVPLPKTVTRPTRFSLRLSEGEVFRGFRIESEGPASVSLDSASIGAFVPAVELGQEQNVFANGITLRDESTYRSGRITLTLSDPQLRTESGGFSVLFSRKSTDALSAAMNPQPVVLTAVSGEKRQEYEIMPFPEGQVFNFPAGLTGFVPDELTLESSVPFTGASFYFSPATEPSPDGSPYDPSIEPITADPGSILRYDRSEWRNRGYELYSWNLFPDILIFDFADYAIQAKFFGRLGFFDAVKGESGKIEPEDYYADRHPYNAHDYNPESLARFFETARTGGVALNDEESFLRDLCLKNGILRSSEGKLVPGKGAVLSVSRETASWLIKRLMTHESMHGIFFAVPEYREACAAIWDGLPYYEQEYFKLFLGNKGFLDGREGYDGYDIENRYLLINEFQAHVMQLEHNQPTAYFMDNYLPRMRTLFPEKSAVLDRIAADPRVFERIRQKLEDALYNSTGLVNGDIYTLTRRTSK